MFSVLYVDDEPGLLDIGKIFLERTGNLVVDTANSATEALALLNNSSYDCVISDYQMPEMDGLAFLKFVRGTWNTLPFILFTGKGREDVVIEALNSGADFYLQKGGEPKSQFAELEHKVRLAVERRRLAEQLKCSERRLSDIIDFLPDPTFAIDLNGNVIAWNRAIEEMTGVGKDKVVGCGDQCYAVHIFGENGLLLIDLILHDNPEHASIYQHLSRQGDKIIGERFVSTLFGGKGAYVWVVASPLYDSDGSVVGAIESIRDITHRKKAEDEIRAAYEQLAAAEEELRQQYQDLARSEETIKDNERRLVDIINFLPDATFAIDLEGTVIAWNNAIEELSGISRYEILGTGDYSYAQLIWGERKPILIDAVLHDDPAIADHYHDLIKKDGKYYAEAFVPGFYGGKGAYIWFTATLLYNSYGEKIGAIESIRDVTDHKREQDELKAAYEQLAATEEELRKQYRDLAWGEERIRKDERFIRDIFSSIQDGITVLDSDLGILKVNEAMDELSHGSQSILGRKCYEVYHHTNCPCDDCPALETLKTGLPSHKLIIGKGEGSHSGRLDVYTYPLYDSEAGKVTGVIEYVRGITDRLNSCPIRSEKP
ncbi:MAG: PAS domain S-box protein [Methanospirillum sp.]|uniref:PAS domain S-box protein n=1 Tax=Methanospirillum sp. TaxID=45200 RepID=UPI002372B1DF|nr:PAS domain S-box protein [Methanospirillum sp.]MDD1728401.1 PAS domain S-box protein [Methanospirillum sp.]